jgi:hypothetical protein
LIQKKNKASGWSSISETLGWRHPISSSSLPENIQLRRRKLGFSMGQLAGNI